MKLVYKFLVPTIAILIVGFYLLLDKTISSKNEVVQILQDSSKDILVEQLRIRKKSQLMMQNKFLNFSANSIANISLNFIDNYDKDGLLKELEYYFNIEAVRAIGVFDHLSSTYFVVISKNGDNFVSSSSISKDFEKYIKITKDIKSYNNKVGFIELYYDDSLILEEISKTEKDVNTQLTKFIGQVNQKKEISKQEEIKTVVLILFIVILLIAVLSHISVNKPLNILKNGLDDFFLFLQNKKRQYSKNRFKL